MKTIVISATVTDNILKHVVKQTDVITKFFRWLYNPDEFPLHIIT